ncbi:MFS transporter [Phytohabitans flavus]|uniref:MFS transporter n=1 Tax=Phytohabitans flavus TaxID=1076124 RepID=UPI003635BA96
MRRNPWATLTVLALAQFITVLDVTIVNVALPDLSADLEFSQHSLPWVINAYTLPFGGLLLLGGRAADLLGARRVFLAGLLLFGVTSLAAGLATSPELLIAARAVQGVGAALLAPAALALIVLTFPPGRQRNIALGVWGSLAGLGGTLGVVAGGLLVDGAGWRWIFFVNVPVVVALLVAAPCSYPPSGTGRLGALSTSRVRCWVRPGCWLSSSVSSGPRSVAGARPRWSAAWSAV